MFKILDYHTENYKEAKERLDKYAEDCSEVYQLRCTLANKRMAGFKFNY